VLNCSCHLNNITTESKKKTRIFVVVTGTWKAFKTKKCHKSSWYLLVKFANPSKSSWATHNVCKGGMQPSHGSCVLDSCGPAVGRVFETPDVNWHPCYVVDVCLFVCVSVNRETVYSYCAKCKIKTAKMARNWTVIRD